MVAGLRISLLSVLFGIASVSFFSFVGLGWTMCKLSNRKLPAESRFSLWRAGRLKWMGMEYWYFDPFAGYSRASREYRRLYPASRVYPLAFGFLITFLGCAAAIFCIRFLQIAIKK